MNEHKNNKTSFEWQYVEVIMFIDDKDVNESNWKNIGRKWVKKWKMWLFQIFIPFYLIYHPNTCLSDAEHTCVPLKSFAGLWRTSNKYKLCPTKIDKCLTLDLSWKHFWKILLMGYEETLWYLFGFFIFFIYFFKT